jgi:predicted anti-sigma-YlaC factor YlaD
MNQVSCESVRLAAMAVADDEKPLIPAPDVELHLAQCDRCRGDVELLKAFIELLNGQRRRERAESVWERVAESLRHSDKARTAPDHWPWFLLLGLLLAGYRVIVAMSDWEPNILIKLATVLLAVAVFVFLRENPFKVNPGLQARILSRGDL